jgi:hypothetical protein
MSELLDFKVPENFTKSMAIDQKKKKELFEYFSTLTREDIINIEKNYTSYNYCLKRS